MAGEWRWRDPAGLGKVVLNLQWGLGAAGVAMFLTDFAAVLASSGLPPMLSEDDPTATRLLGAVMVNGVATLVYGVILVVAGVASLRWIMRTNRNAQTWASGMRVSPGWAAGWFFVPIAGLWKPFQGVNDTWRVSADPQAWRTLPAPTLLRWWWAIFLIDSVLGSLVGRLAAASHTVGDDRIVALVSLVSDASDVALAIVFWRVVRELGDLQAARHQAVGDPPRVAGATTPA